MSLHPLTGTTHTYDSAKRDKGRSLHNNSIDSSSRLRDIFLRRNEVMSLETHTSHLNFHSTASTSISNSAAAKKYLGTDRSRHGKSEKRRIQDDYAAQRIEEDSCYGSQQKAVRRAQRVR
jgi:hypothetical protein